jgi:single-strand DNA-binding protein
MFDTNIVIIGNVMTAPEWRRTTNTNSLVANFKVASTSRRLDRETGRWVDGNSLRVRVNCWRKLAEGVASSIMVGDPVVVVGRLYTRDWTDADGNPRTMYEMEAVAIGHDLARGRGSFRRNRPTLGTSAVEDGETESQVHGAPAEQVAEGEVPVRFGDGVYDDGQPDFDDVPPSGPASDDPVVVVRGGGFAPGDRRAPGVSDPGAPASGAPARSTREAEPGDGGPGGSRPAGSGPGDTPRSDEPGDDAPTGGDGPADGGSTESGVSRRPRRNGRRIPVPA